MLETIWKVFRLALNVYNNIDFYLIKNPAGIFDKECGSLTANAGQLPQPTPQSKPTIPLLKRLTTQSGGIIPIIERIGVKSHDLGICLLKDDTGTITDAIEAQHRPDQNRITEAILQKWLQGTGRTPQSWATLITVLREIELNVLAQEIKQNLWIWSVFWDIFIMYILVDFYLRVLKIWIALCMHAHQVALATVVQTTFSCNFYPTACAITSWSGFCSNVGGNDCYSGCSGFVNKDAWGGRSNYSYQWTKWFVFNRTNWVWLYSRRKSNWRYR